MKDALLIVVGLTLLVLGGNWLLKAAVGFSLKLKIPKMVIGLTIVSMATSMPELIVSINSALEGIPDLAVGNVLGSNIANIALVLGVTTLITDIDVKRDFLTLDWPILMVVSLGFWASIYWDTNINFWEGIFYVISLIIVLFLFFYLRKGDSKALEEVDETAQGISTPLLFFYLLIGAIGLWLGSEWLIDGSTSLAKKMGASEAIIGLTVVAIGTSVPELAASIIAAVKGQKSIGLGNIVGSNIFNILSVLGFTAIIKEIPIANQFLSSDIYWMLFFSVILVVLVLIPKRYKIFRVEGAILLLLYGYYIYQFLD